MERIKKPKTCIGCPFKEGVTRNCGELHKEQNASTGARVTKVPDSRCLLQGIEISERLKKALIEYGTRF